MDGTGLLYEPLLKQWPERTRLSVVPYPADKILTYDQVEAYVKTRLPVHEPYVLVAESYGGPIAVRIAAQHPPMLSGLVLSATFVRRPRGNFGEGCRGIVGPYLFRLTWLRGILEMILRWQGMSEGRMHLVVGALDRARPEVLAARLKDALTVDAYEDLKKCGVPILCLYAKRDFILPDHCRETILEANPSVKLVGLDTPHFLFQSKPAEAFREIQAFTRTLKIPA